MNNTTKPWNAPSDSPRQFSFIEAGARLPDALRRAMACVSLHLRRTGNWWSARLRSLWQQGDVGSRMAAVGLFVAGLATILFMAYLLIYLLPFLILAAFIAAICSAFAVNRGDQRYR
jgi:hypothetical protein